MKIDGYTRMAAVIAHPIRHSISPFIHNLAYELTATNAAYLAWDIAEEDLESTISQIRKLDMIGANISMPYKQKVFPYLDEVDEMARKIGSVNTIVHRNSKLKGYNTDGIGFFRSLPMTFSMKNGVMAILGAGGAASAIVAHAIAQGAAEIHLFERSEGYETSKQRLDQLGKNFQFDLQLHYIKDTEKLQTILNKSDLILNATGVGMEGESLPIPESIQFPKEAIIADMIYFPAETPFLKLGRQQGNQTLNGLGMLFYQAEKAFELMTEKDFPADAVWEALKNEYSHFIH